MPLIIAAAVVALLVAAGGLYQFIGSRVSAGRYVPPGIMVDVLGQRLHVICAGNGRPAVLFESGIAASSLSWARVLGEVGTFARACAYDRAGLGWSAPSRIRRTVATMLREVRGVLMNVAPTTRAVLVGHSFCVVNQAGYGPDHSDI